MLNNKTIAAFVTFVLGGFLYSFASFGSDFHSPRTDGLGGAGHASPFLGDTIYLNPSFAPFIQTHSVSLNYLVYGQGQINTPYGLIPYYGHDLNASIVDGTSETLFQAGVGYTVRDDSQMIHMIAAKQITQRISVGVGGKVIFPTSQLSAHPFDGTVSATAILASWFQAALIVDNFFQSAANFGFNRETILGTKFNVMDIVMIYVDPHIFDSLPSNQLFGYEAGAEFPFFSDLFLRTGGFQNSTIPYQGQLGSGFGVGVGWVAPKISLEAAFSRASSPIAANSYNFGVSVFF